MNPKDSLIQPMFMNSERRRSLHGLPPRTGGLPYRRDGIEFSLRNPQSKKHNISVDIIAATW